MQQLCSETRIGYTICPDVDGPRPTFRVPKCGTTPWVGGSQDIVHSIPDAQRVLTNSLGVGGNAPSPWCTAVDPLDSKKKIRFVLFLRGDSSLRICGRNSDVRNAPIEPSDRLLTFTWAIGAEVGGAVDFRVNRRSSSRKERLSRQPYADDRYCGVTLISVRFLCRHVEYLLLGTVGTSLPRLCGSGSLCTNYSSRSSSCSLDQVNGHFGRQSTRGGYTRIIGLAVYHLPAITRKPPNTRRPESLPQ